MIRTRIAPSPTGNLHIGTARTALFNYLFAKKLGGSFVVRIEDTDLERSDKKYEKNILDGLVWLGIEADESPIVGGPYGPYRQSERTASYTGYLQKLLETGHAFYCFHSAKELEDEKNNLLKIKKPPIHLCEYRNMDSSEAEIFKEVQGDYVIRFKNHVGKKISFLDLIRGELSFETDLMGDFSIAKRLDVPLYNFAVVIDDFEMEISHVIRGEDHLANTPKQILLQEALGLPRPKYAHLPLILGSDRSKMSKRHGETSVNEYRQVGYLPETLFNFMSLLGWNSGDEKEIMNKEEIILKFSLDKVHKSGAIFDVVKLDWMNGEYIRKMDIKNLVEAAKTYLPKNSAGKEYISKVLAVEQPRLKKLSEITEKTDYFFKMPDYDKNLLSWKNMAEEEVTESLNLAKNILLENKDLQDIEKFFLETAAKMGDRGRLLWPLRVALSGKKASASPFEILSVLGNDRALKRIHNALDKLI